MPFFTHTDWRWLRVSLVAAVPIEALCLWLFSTVPLDLEPSVKPGVIATWAGIVTVILHFPAVPLLKTGLTKHPILIQCAFFLTGYAVIVMFLSLLVLLHRTLIVLMEHVSDAPSIR